MTEPGARPAARLYTIFGSVLFVDEPTGELRHGPIDSSPANLALVAGPQVGRPLAALVHVRDGVANAIGAPVEVVCLGRGLIGLLCGDRYLTAEPDGRVTASRPWCSTWECFLASEDWCAAAPDDAADYAGIDRRAIAHFIIDPRLRAKANAASAATKVLIYGYPQWSHGRVYYDLCKQLHRKGCIVDILHWQHDHSAYFAALMGFYDLVLTAPDGVRTLVDHYGVPCERIIAVSHHEMDIRMLLEQKGADIFDRFAGYGAVSEFVYCASLMQGVRRPPKVVSLGINFAEFYAPPSETLRTVGYASSMSVVTYGVEWKRGHLAEAAAREAGLAFRVAGSTAEQTSFHDMPDFYRTVDAVLTSSISEAAQLPVMEAAAAGRLVIGTPVGHFPLKAYQGGGIIAPIEPEKFVAFAAETLRYYHRHPDEYRRKCQAIQEAARRFDWHYSIGDWVELITAARARAVGGDAPC